MLKHSVSYVEPADIVTTIVLNLQSRFALLESNLRMFATDVMIGSYYMPDEVNQLISLTSLVEYDENYAEADCREYLQYCRSIDEK